MLEPGSLVLVLILCAMLSVLSYWFGLLSISGAVASFAVGIIIGGFGSVGWLITLIAFAFLGFFVTKFRFQAKKKLNVQEGTRGERTYRNVLANGLVPALVAIVSFALGMQGSEVAAIAFISSVAVAAADTTASELGVLSSNTYLITTGQRVAAGTDGGVSAAGTASCIIAAAVASIVGWLAIFQSSPLEPLIIVPTAMGVAGCMLDSVVGATLERRGMVTKLGNNMMTMAAGSALSVLLYLALF